MKPSSLPLPEGELEGVGEGETVEEFTPEGELPISQTIDDTNQQTLE